MKRLIALGIIAALLSVALLAPSPGAALEGYVPAEVQCKVLLWHDSQVLGYSYIDERGVVDDWTVPNDVAIVGSLVYFEVDPIGWPEYQEGRIMGDVELALDGVGANRTLNKADLHVVLGNEGPTKSWPGAYSWGNFVEQSTVMFPAGTAVIVEEGNKVDLIADGWNDMMRPNCGAAMYFRAYIWYVNLN